jgi:ATP phosphoribosyltransferase
MRFLGPSEAAHGFCDWLISNGARTVTVATLDFIYTAKNALWDELRARLQN